MFSRYPQYPDFKCSESISPKVRRMQWQTGAHTRMNLPAS